MKDITLENWKEESSKIACRYLGEFDGAVNLENEYNNLIENLLKLKDDEFVKDLNKAFNQGRIRQIELDTKDYSDHTIKAFDKLKSKYKK